MALLMYSLTYYQERIDTLTDVRFQYCHDNKQSPQRNLKCSSINAVYSAARAARGRSIGRSLTEF